MPMTIQCPTCSQRYQVADGASGKNVRCRKCGGTFIAGAATSSTSPLPAPTSPTGLNTFPELPSSPPAAPAALSPVAGSSRPVPISNPSGGPTDGTMRLVSAGMFVLGIVLLGLSFVAKAQQGTVYLMAVALAPVSACLGLAGMISPNVVRAAGKYGGHLPFKYKLIAIGVLTVALILTLLLIVAVLL